MMFLITSFFAFRANAFAAAPVAIISERFMSNKETRRAGIDENKDATISATPDAPYHMLEFVDTIQDIRDIVSDFKAIARSQSILIDTTNQVVIASHLADVLVDVFNRMFQKNVSCKFAQVIVRTISLATIHAADPLLEHPEQIVLQGILLITATTDLIDAHQSCGLTRGRFDKKMESEQSNFA
jgi:hypothetical protein